MTPAPPGRLLDREHELARVAHVLERAAAGSGAALMVEGPPGIGKTALLDLGLERARQQGLAVQRARGGELERALGYGVARDLLARRVDAVSADARSGLVAGAAEIALPALGLGRADGLPPEEAAIHHGLTWLVANLAEEQPLALVVDDVQWADAESAAWLLHLARRVDDLPVALLLAARPPGGKPEQPGLQGLRELAELERLRPAPLEAPSVAALVRAFYAAEADDRFISACHAAAGGNPFHTHALLDAAALLQISPTEAGAEALAELAPEAVQRSVAAALRRAGREAEALAEACAVLGDSVALRHAAALAGLDMASGAAAADRLSDENLLVRGRPLRFVHPILLAAVRERIGLGERAVLHHRAAALFESEGDVRQAAAHLLEVEPAGDPAVVATLVAAAGEAAAEGAMSHGARLLERSLAEPAPADQRPFLLGLLGRARFFAHTGDAFTALLTAADAAEAVEDRARLLATAAWATVLEEPKLLADVARRVAALPPGSGEGRMRATATVAITLRWAGMPPQPPTAELIELAEPLAGDTAAERELLAAAALAAQLEVSLPAERLVSLTRRALRSPENTPAPAALNAVQIAAVAGAADEALPAVNRAIAGCRRRGNQTGLAGLIGARMMVHWWRGRHREAEADARMCWEMLHSGGRAFALLSMLTALTARGLVEEARDLVEQHGPFRIGSGTFVHDLLAISAGLLDIESGNLRAGADVLVAAEGPLERQGLRSALWAFPHRPFAVEALVRLGDAQAARALAEKDLEMARALGAPGILGYAVRGLGLAVGRADGRGLIEEGVALLEESGERDRLARALLDLGRALRLEGRPTDARAPLRRSLDLAEACGAGLVSQRAFDELRATGAKPRRRALRGPESLTPSEARIARLAAEGRTNREIAQTLFLSTKTVTTHLGHIYGKLDISGRGELPQALDPTPN